MIISRDWLIKYIPKLVLKNNQEIADAFNFLGFEVEQIKNYKQNSNVVCGKIINCEMIADTHLNLCQVLIAKEKKIQIICGANNVAKDALVLVALPGAKLANNKEISVSVIKGHKSEGMLCGWDELGIDASFLTTTETGGIALLPVNEFKKFVGSSEILKMLGLEDTVFILDLTINRSDCWGMYQLAIELANFFHFPIMPLAKEPLPKQSEKITKVKIESKNIISSVISVLEIEPNNYHLPMAEILFLKKNELAVVNNNINNFALLAELTTAQPLYLFDYDKLKTLTIKEQIVAGDNKLIFSHEAELIGIIGQEINKQYLPDENTKKILVMACNINYAFMRKQLQKEQQTNHFYQRFSKPMAIGGLELGFVYFLALLNQNKIRTKIISLMKAGEQTNDNKPILVSITEINNIIGCNFIINQVKELLEPLNFAIKILNNKQQQLEIKSPIMRTDILQKADIFEEIARLYGYNNIPMTAPKIINQRKISILIEKIIDVFETACFGWNINQVKTYALTTNEDVNQFNFFNYKSNYQLKMPMSQEHSVMRVSLLHQLITIAEYNNNRNIIGNFFTVEKIYFNNLQNNYHGAILLQQNDLSFAVIKGKISSFLSHLGIDIFQIIYKPTEKWPVTHPFQTAEIIYQKHLLGIIGKLNPRYIKQNNLADSYFCELNLTELEKILTDYETKIVNISKFMPIKRDLSMLIPDDCSYQTIFNLINNKILYLINCQLKDYYSGNNLPENYKSFTFTLEFNDINKQLTDEDIKISMEKIFKNLKSSKWKIMIR